MNESQVVEQAITVQPSESLSVSRTPEAVLSEAKEAAQALKRVLDSKPDKVTMNGEVYLEFEDWQTLGRFYGLTACEEGDPELVTMPDGVVGFKASSVALDRDAVIRSRATAFCLSDEEKWSTRTKYAYAYVTKSGGHSIEDPGKDEIVWVDNPDKPGKKRPKKERIVAGEEKVPFFQLASMAQTRANSKVLRNLLSWVVVLAGYKPTPAEEMGTFHNSPVPQPEANETTSPKPESKKAIGIVNEFGPGRARPASKPVAEPKPAPVKVETVTVEGSVDHVAPQVSIKTNKKYHLVKISGQAVVVSNDENSPNLEIELLNILQPAKAAGRNVVLTCERRTGDNGKKYLFAVSAAFQAQSTPAVYDDGFIPLEGDDTDVSSLLMD